MKKSFKFWKSWIVVSAIAGFLVACWVVVYAATSGPFDSWKATETGLPLAEWSTTARQLSASKWNSLMDSLNGLAGLNAGEAIPNWMIAPFYNGCPNWWTYYSTAKVPGETLHDRIWCQKWSSDWNQCFSEVCWYVNDGGTCITYATNISDNCDAAKRVSTCYDGVWSPNPYPDWYVQHWYSYCNTPGQWSNPGGSETCTTSYNRPPCPSPYTNEEFVVDNGEWKVYNCKKPGSTTIWCQVYKCKNTSCLFYQWHCYYPDSNAPAGVSQSICNY